MKTEKVKISHLVTKTELKELYSAQSIDELVNSIEVDGLKTPIIVSKDFEIIDGYRRVEALIHLGIEYVDVLIDEVDPSVFDRIIRNMYRTKTADDKVKEVQAVFERFPKKMGQKSDDGSVYNRTEKIAAALNKKYCNKDTISKLEYIINNDLDNLILSKGIIENNWKVDTCHEFLTKWKTIDEEKKYGYTKKLCEGEITISEANKFIETHLDLEQDHTTFIIPEKCYSYNTNCIEIEENEEFHNKVQLVFTSVYYWQQRFYEVGEVPQPGHEQTKEEYLDSVSKIFIPVCKTLTESSVVAVNIADSIVDGIPQRIPYLFIDYMEKNTPLKFIGEIIWSKKNPRGNGSNEDKVRPKNKIEYIMTFAINPKKVKYRKLQYRNKNFKPTIAKGFKDVSKYGKIKKMNKVLNKGYVSIKNHIYEQEVENIITTSCGENNDVKKIIKNGHPAIMSAMLPISLILMYTDEGDLVYDCMSGSNVVGRASQLLNRRTLSTELSPKYFKLGCRMLENSIKEFNRYDLDMINQISYSEDELSVAA